LGALVIAEHNGARLSPSTWSCISAASKVGTVDLTVLVLGGQKISPSVAEQASRIGPVKKVLTYLNPCLENSLAENMAKAISIVVEHGNYEHVFAPSSNASKAFLPRVGARIDAAPITDVVDVLDQETFVRPMYAGNALAKVQSSDSTKLLSIRTTAFEKAEDTTSNAPIEAVSWNDANAGISSFKSEAVSSSARPDLAAARVVVSGGRGLKSGENFALLDDLADKLGAAVGASRAAVDAGFVPNELQVGQTGKVVAPDLYIAVGISGAIQHLSGMKDSKTIVAINKDPDAPIFQVSDYGLVADLFEAVPELTEKC